MNINKHLLILYIIFFSLFVGFIVLTILLYNQNYKILDMKKEENIKHYYNFNNWKFEVDEKLVNLREVDLSKVFNLKELKPEYNYTGYITILNESGKNLISDDYLFCVFPEQLNVLNIKRSDQNVYKYNDIILDSNNAFYSGYVRITMNGKLEFNLWSEDGNIVSENIIRLISDKIPNEIICFKG